VSAAADPASLIAAIAARRIGCVGDLMLDRFVRGTVERISPEAPIPVLTVATVEAMLGGAGNVVRNLVELGAAVRCAGVVGDDSAGGEIRERLAGLAGVTATVFTDPLRPTTVKTRFLAGGQQILRTDEEVVAPLPAPLAAELLGAVRGFVGDCEALVLSDYGKGVLAGAVAAAIIAAAHEAAVTVVVDPKGEDYRRYAGAHVVTPNRRELAAALGRSVAPGEEEAGARRLIDACGFGAVLVTLGAEGVLLVPSGGAAERIEAAAREVFDVSGAGDTVAATLAAALAAGAPLADAARLANVAAGIVVGKVGTAAVGAAELADAVRLSALRLGEAKIASLDTAVVRTAVWRRQGLTIGFTNGCFDLLHPGHVSLLRQARSACDRLIVGLNTDRSVARLKGPGRPIQNEAARALVLASLETVDLVVPFADDTPIRLIEAIAPDVLVKGADWRLEAIVGAEFVRSRGGRVLVAELAPGYSTTATVDRLTKSKREVS
jgi:D-beta-D-heptose 7-phosphate kinase/D-beta-D-heptose 1-phosphate adenosyltransferase